MKTRKSINYAYPHSPAAKTLGMSGTGCHYVATSVFREGASWSPASPAHNAEGFLNATDPDLLAMYNETEGEPCPYFLRYGTANTLRALKAMGPAVARPSRQSASSRLAAQL